MKSIISRVCSSWPQVRIPDDKEGVSPFEMTWEEVSHQLRDIFEEKVDASANEVTPVTQMARNYYQACMDTRARHWTTKLTIGNFEIIKWTLSGFPLFFVVFYVSQLLTKNRQLISSIDSYLPWHKRLEEVGLSPLTDLIDQLGGWPVLETEGSPWNELQFQWDETVFKLRDNGRLTLV